jgi:hypothetical protein
LGSETVPGSPRGTTACRRDLPGRLQAFRLLAWSQVRPPEGAGQEEKEKNLSAERLSRNLAISSGDCPVRLATETGPGRAPPSAGPGCRSRRAPTDLTTRRGPFRDRGRTKKLRPPIRGQSVDRILSLHLVGRRSRAPARNRSWYDLWPRSPNTPAARPALTRGVSGLPDIRAGKAEQERTRSETWCNSLGEWAGHLGRERSLPINAWSKTSCLH